ncbi:MAG TPA: penicillin-binding protein 2 [Fimbriimonadales bacterium]|nr:penicillin-binding protein 2 [Fimbriimonadales bacterium]
MLLAALFVCVLGNQARVQLLERNEIIALAKERKRLFVTETIIPTRGEIFSKDGKVLASASDTCLFGINRELVPRTPTFFFEVSSITGVSAAELMDFDSDSQRGGVWEVELSRDKIARLLEIKSRYLADGLWVQSGGGNREYPFGAVAASVVGYLQDGIPRSGIEKSLDKLLSGNPGKLVGMTDKEGDFLPWLMSEETKPGQDGSDVVLTIDSEIQRIAYESVSYACKKHKADAGVAVVLDPKTGDLLALAAFPSFEDSQAEREWSSAIKGERISPELNPGVGLRFEPGSVFKVFTLALGLESGVILPGETVYCGGKKQFSAATIHCSGDHSLKSHGSVGVQRCMEVSCNVAAATWGVEIGFERFARMVEKLGLLQSPGIMLKPEVPGEINYHDWNKTIQMANLGFGQSINVTPVGLASALSVFANDGIMVRPRLVHSIGGRFTKSSEKSTVFKPETANKILIMMEKVIHGEEGTGKKLRIPGYTLAGKSGTAQKRDALTRTSTRQRYVSWFVGFVPAMHPKVVIVVAIDNPTSGTYYGAAVAGPVFRDIAAFLIQKYEIPPDRPEELYAIEKRKN